MCVCVYVFVYVPWIHIIERTIYCYHIDFTLSIYKYMYIYIYICDDDDDDDDIKFSSTKIGSCRPLRSCGKKIIIK